jgi:hypothetical protein
LLAVVWGAVLAPPTPSSTIPDTRDAPAVITPGRALDNEDD